MAHNLETFEDGSSSFFSAREVAWHKLGVVTPNALTAEEALRTAQLDWEVLKSGTPVSTTVPSLDGKGVETINVENKYMTYRYHPQHDKPTALGVVGDRYTPVQNSEAFSFLNDLADESGAVFETAGSINDGKKVFMTMKMPQDILIGGQDAVNTYLLAWNTHDGTSSFHVAVTPIRVVCQNTLSMAIRNAKSSYSLRHTPKVSGRVQAARETLKLTYKYVDAFEKEAESLISQSLTDREFSKIVEKLVPIKDDEERARNVAEEARGALMQLWKAPTQANIAGTKWAAYNAVVEYADWARPVRGSNQDLTRAIRNLNGASNAFKMKALSLIS